MKSINILLFSLFILPRVLLSQVGIGTNLPQSTLHIEGNPTNPSITDGIIIPRLSGDQLALKDLVYNQVGILVYVTSPVTLSTAKTINVTAAGLYYFDGIVWRFVSSSSAVTGWSSIGNSGTNPNVNFIGTTDLTDFRIRTNNLDRISVAQNGNVGVGTDSPTTNLDLNGGLRVRGAFYDVNNSSGSAGQILSSTQTGTQWINGTGAGLSFSSSIYGSINFGDIFSTSAASINYLYGASMNLVNEPISEFEMVEIVFNTPKPSTNYQVFLNLENNRNPGNINSSISDEVVAFVVAKSTNSFVIALRELEPETQDISCNFTILDLP